MKPDFQYARVDAEELQHRVVVGFGVSQSISLEELKEARDIIFSLRLKTMKYEEAGNTAHISAYGTLKFTVCFLTKTDAMRYRLMLGI